MTQQSSLVLQGTTARKWTFHPLQHLAPEIRLARDLSTNTLVVIKSVSLPDENARSLLLSDAAAWRRVSLAVPSSVVRLLDVCQDALTVHLLMEYCERGSLQGEVKSERAALRAVSSVAAALEAVLMHSGQSAHANVSTANILLGEGGVKLAGWGWSRARRMAKRKLGERDDVRALGGVLYEILYGKRYDANVGVEDDERVSKVTKTLLKTVLGGGMELTAFRYDVMAARGMLPVCGQALKPIVNSRREEFLGNDLDSIRGLNGTEERGREEKEREEVEEEAVVEVRSAPMTNVGGEGGVTEVVKRLVGGEVGDMDDEIVERLIESCAKVEDMPERVFKVLFTLPISKNPVIAFKTVALLNRLLAEGVAKLTALAITHDGFLSWIQGQWSAERVRGRGAKAHMLAYCFAGGEISVYTALIRKRIEMQAKYAKVLSTHWVPRPDGLAGLGGRGEVIRGVREVVEKCAVLLRMLFGSKDPLGPAKMAVAPMVVAEMAKAYHVVCWLYATSHEAEQDGIREELEAAHRLTRVIMNAVRAEQEIAEKCASNALLELEEEIPKEFDVAQLVTALRKKRRKKKKKKTVAPVEEQKPLSNEDDKSPKVSEGEEEPKPPSEEEQLAEDEEEPEETPVEEESPARRAAVVPRREPNGTRGATEKRYLYAARLNGQNQNGQNQYARAREMEAGRGDMRNGEVAAMAKLSLSVRGTSSRPTNGYQGPLSSRPIPRARSPHRGRSLSPVIDRRRRGGPRSRSPHDRVYMSGSGSDEDVVDARANGKEEVRGRRKNGNLRRARASSRDSEQSESESESEEEKVPKKPVRVKKSKGRKAKDSSDESAESEEKEETETEKTKRRVERKRSPKKKAVDEKSIPFDKETPTRKKAKEKAAAKAATKKQDEEYSGGSKEALAAAASGKKTPNMNPKFEVAPYEVQYGPQIGSGGFGVVFKARFRGETVAVKKIHAHALTNAASVAEFQSEVAVLCTLRHPNILRFVGACTKPPHLMIITEFMSRGTLFDVLHQSQMRVTWPMRKKFALDTCKGMRYLHDSKLLHRDLKSSNLMLDKDFNCKVGDFGLTRISKGTAAAQMTGQCGTFQYMAVEVLANKPYSEKADVFSFGILLWEMVARKLPYFGMQPMQVGIAVLQQGMRPPIPAKCPAPLAKLMRACWDSDPNRRPSFAQLTQALEAMPE